MAFSFFRPPSNPPIIGPLGVQIEAALIAGTRFAAVGGAFSSAWMRQYQAGSQRLELRLEPSRNSATLHGCVHATTAGHVSLESEEGRVIATTALDAAGCFQLPVRFVGGYQLRINLENASIMVSDFDIV